MAQGSKLKLAKDYLVETFQEWKNDDGLQWGAALAYYAVFALGPILFITFAIAGTVWSAETVAQRVYSEASSTMGAQTAEFLSTLVTGAIEAGTSGWGLAIAIGMLIFAATGAFAQLNVALNRMWDIRAKPERSWLHFLKKRAMSFLYVLGVAALLLVTVVASALIGQLGTLIDGITPATGLLMQLIGEILVVGAMTVLFAAIFRYLPDAVIGWHEVWLGAFVTALLFEVGKITFGIYVSYADLGSGYGAAGSLIALLVWFWFAAQLFFFGAEFTQIHARRRGVRIEPEEHAIRIGDPKKSVPPEIGAAT